ncbi:hypothetical protein BV394_04830 [Brevirhabdus pacifica]|uniref:Uncharacterized protein n=1 Tax=Brevirhabdus pacifica TaxID=1267768 RepID=A0A1U7DGL3_9RHOB|nr:hypothetical protein [Brevirhabdus pacifica]APX89122.1 hypothetical protein BV394_04830 [Brevirhabdus pacifica]OWU76818.1 hypothetical protein ATO5_11460 [Loktanella sp. 22II-4b]PJJ86287.1 hypothetical protein CLV77_0825 [Brevirhabdus pacifica]
MKKLFAAFTVFVVAMAMGLPAAADKGGIPNENASDKAQGSGGGGKGNGHATSNGKGHDKEEGKHAEKWHS